MDPRLIERVRAGQAELRERQLGLLLVGRGLVTAADVAAPRPASAGLGEALVRDGRLSRAQLDDASRALDELATVVDDATPAEVGAAAQRSGARLGKYVIVERVGQGGMGEVWRAWDGQLGRWVALKLLKVHEPAHVRRFMREATLLARLSHPNITRVYDVGVHEQRPYLAMELVDGGSLSGRKQRRKRAAATVRDAARAVQHAHDAGIVHRDLKPSNLLVSQRGTVYVTDFGLARAREGESLTQSGALLGTPSYMAPEQAQGLRADERTDVYGLGATLYALVAGVAPFTGDLAAEVVRRVAHERAPTLADAGDLAVICAKAMERERADRYASAAELADDLQRFLDDQPIRARRIGTLARAWRRARRRPLLSALFALALVAISAGSFAGARAARAGAERRAAERRAEALLSEARPIVEGFERLGDADSAERRSALAVLEQASAAALAAAPDYAPALYCRALWVSKSVGAAAAIPLFERALALDAELFDARARLALAVLAAADLPMPTLLAERRGLRVSPAPLDEPTRAALARARDELARLPAAHPDRWRIEAQLDFAAGRYDEVAARLGGLLAARPYLSDVLRPLVWSELASGAFESAEQHTSDMLRRGLDLDAAHAVRSHVRAVRGRYDLAAEDMQAAIARRPADATLRGWLAFWWLKDGQAQRALPLYDALLAEHPDEVAWLTARALCRIHLGRRDEALVDAEHAVGLAPGEAEPHYLRGLALGESEPALAALSRALELDAEHTPALGARALVARALGRYDEALVDARRALELDPETLYWRWLIAFTETEKGDLAAAEQSWSEVLAREPDAPDALNMRGLARALQGRCDEAHADFDAAARLGKPLDAADRERIALECGER